MGTPKGTPVDVRFWMKVEKTDTCWVWVGGKTKNGYGMFGTENTGTVTTAHRWSYERFVGPIPAGMQVDHLCRIRCCVNPDHLEPVTQRENIRRARAAGPYNYTKRTTTGTPRARSPKASRAPRELAPCGTHAAYMRHRRAGEEACTPCLEARRAYMREWAARKTAS